MGIINRVLTAGEFGAAKYAVGINPATGRVRDEFKAGYMRAIGGAAKSIAAAAGVETVQETLQTAGEILNTTYDTAKYKGKTMSEILSEKSSELLVGTVGGFAGGGILATPRAALGASKQILQTRAKAVGDRAVQEHVQNLANDDFNWSWTI